MKPSVASIFRPRSVAVIGATNKPHTLARELVSNLLRSEFTGKVFPVNPRAPVVLCMKSYRSVLEIEDPVDLAVIIVAKEQVLSVVDECGRKGVKGLVIITSGFREVGGDGIERERELAARIAHYGMRAIGPNCMGVVNTDPAFSLNATFSTVRPPAGNIAFVTQSGALGDAIIAHGDRVGIGFSMFASMGNAVDVSANDLLRFWGDDANTDVILLYLESFGEPQQFTKIARDISRRKSLIAVKAGRTDAGARAAFSHSGSLAGLDAGVDALLDQCGVIRVTTVGELFDVALAVSCQPLPTGKRVGIITNAGGPGIMATDAAVSVGLEVPELQESTRQQLKQVLRAEASVRNPIDVIAIGGADDYRAAISACGDDPNVDALIVIFIPPIMIDAPAVARAIVDATAQLRERGNCKPVLTCFMNNGVAITEALAALRAARLPIYLFPESAARALAAMVRLGQWRARPEGTLPTFNVDIAAAQAIVSAVRQSGRRALSGDEARRLFEIYGVPVARRELVSDLDAATRAADAIGYPVVLKIEAAGLVHKTDVGAVITDVRTVAELVDGIRELKRIIAARQIADAQILVQPMISGGREVIFGVARDPVFGPLLMFGLGGVDVEVLHDVAFRVHPITDDEAAEMVRAIRARRLLEGYRGHAAADLELLQSILLRISQLVGDLPEIEQIDVNPFLVTARGGGSAAVDVRVLLDERAG